MEQRLPATPLIDANALVLDEALQLLQQAGALLPDEVPMSAAWLQVDHAFPAWAFARVLVPALVLIPLGCYPGLRHVTSRETAASSLRFRGVMPCVSRCFQMSAADSSW